MDLTLVTTLKATCVLNSTVDNVANLDQNTASAETVDSSYFMQIQKNKGILGIDQEIDLDTPTNVTVAALANNNNLYLSQFGAAMVKMGAVNVLLEPQGQIWLSCRSIN
ncbi:peroxidase 60-like [Telopea speciosissima]|uniref:peroxidase 60-like n=1 Tax=Telopea speciosissima TaxID=54955 RepID=UPI001CC5A867|nr:peroxidase 60-like [Telopea speciosissima]